MIKEQQLRDDFYNAYPIISMTDMQQAFMREVFTFFMNRLKEQEEELVRKCARIAREQKFACPELMQDKPFDGGYIDEKVEQIALQIESLLGKE